MRGASLIELMVAITIGLLVMAGMIGLVASVSSSRGELEKFNVQIENGRYAFETLADDIRHAGYYGIYQNTGAAAGTAVPDACTTDVAVMGNSLGMPVQGISNYGSGNPEAVRLAKYDCLPATAIVSGTDVLVIRRASTAVIAVDSAGVPSPATTANTVYLQSGLLPDASSPSQFYSGFVLAAPTATTVDLSVFRAKMKDSGTGSSAANPATFTTPAPLRKYIVHIYFVSPCSQEVLDCSSGDGIPSLKRLELGAGLLFPAPEVIAAGIEDFQVDYGLNTGSVQVTEKGTSTYFNGSVTSFKQCTPTSASSYESSSCFQDVVALRISLLARNIEVSPGYKDERTYDLGLKGAVGPRNDSYKRHVYSGLVRVNSTAMGRECVPTYSSPC